jgi:hypothetical protein
VERALPSASLSTPTLCTMIGAAGGKLMNAKKLQASSYVE